MSNPQQHLDSIKDIRNIMERNSRFISLSGWSGIAAGICALAGTYFAGREIQCWQSGDCRFVPIVENGRINTDSTMLWIAILTFAGAFITAFLFTYIRSRKKNIPVWGYTARRVIINVAIPMLAGAIVIFHLMNNGLYEMAAPVSLIFYGLALISAGKYTLAEIRYLGLLELLLGLICLWFPEQGLYFWAIGFGVLHILYGIIMWLKYERDGGSEA